MEKYKEIADTVMLTSLILAITGAPDRWWQTGIFTAALFYTSGRIYQWIKR